MTKRIHLEVGARGTSNYQRLSKFNKQISLWGCDADETSIYDPEIYDFIIPKALSSKSGNAILYQTAKPSCSSLFKPNYQWLRDYSWLFESHQIVDQLSIELDTIDSYLVPTTNKLVGLSIDTQGSELDVLSGASLSLKDTLFIQTEAQLLPQYLNASRLDDILSFLLGRDFILYDLQRIWLKADVARGYGHPKGCLWYCELTLFKDPHILIDSFSDLSLTESIEAIVDYVAYCRYVGALDLALTLLADLSQTNTQIYNEVKHLHPLLLKKSFVELKFKGQGYIQRFIQALDCIFARSRYSSWLIDHPISRNTYPKLPF